MQSAAVLRTADSPSASHFSWAASFDCITGPRTTSYRMIGTFWNLCRACPSMPVDKLHSEYRSTYRWHEYTGPRQEVVRKPPQPVAGNKEEEENKNIENKIAPPPTLGGGIEPQLPRRKKNPSLAYRSHDLLTRRDNDSTSLDRARCAERRGAERERTGRRSKSEGPPQQAPSSPPVQSRVLRSDSDPSQFAQDLMCNLPSEGGGLKQAISRISTEYRLQFAWPRGKRTTEEESTGPPRKSLSMGAIKPTVQNQQLSSVGQQIQNQPAPVHKKRITQADKNAGTAELEPLVSNHEDYSGEEKIIQESFSKGEKLNLSDNIEFKTEYKKKFRPFSQYDYIDGRFKPKKEPEPQILPEVDNEHGTWFSEVIELRKKAGEYKHRGWGTELVPEHIAELYNKQISLWEQVSRRSSLSALSLASSTHHRHISKEEKEKENNKKSSPTKALWSEQVARVNQKNEKDGTPRSRIDHFIRHHLERTTGVGEEGILHSPTREKLEPVIIRRKDTTPDSSSRSPQKVQTGRSQSAGPNTTGGEKCSPKRASRPPHPPKTAPTEKKQRPTTLDTAPSRTKPKTGSNKGATAKVPMPSGTRVKQNLTDSQSTPKEKAGDEVDSSEAEILEPVVKSPPEPTRVKSPEQVLMRSPEPVNWTVPLDTGKTFTVTQNVSEGESLCRPQSESRVRSEAEAPPAPPQSAPPALSQDTDLKKEAEEEKKKLLEKPVPGTTLRCLDDPSFTFDSSSHEPKPSTDVLEKAQSRFDQFWGKTNQENMDNQGQA